MTPMASNPNIGAILQLYGMVKRSANPQEAIMRLMRENNPTMVRLNQIIQANGGDATTAFNNLSRQYGINPNDILSLLS